jgi:CheY-like chemotaxis protein
MTNLKPYHFVMMDNFMVKLNGPEAAAQMREAKFKGAIIGVTGNASSDDIDSYKKLGADHVLAKPITRANLIAALSAKYGKK